MASIPRENVALVRGDLTSVVGDTHTPGILLTDESVEPRPTVDDRVRVDTVSPECRDTLATSPVHIAVDDVGAADGKMAVRGTVTGTRRDRLPHSTFIGRPVQFVFAWDRRNENCRIGETGSLSGGAKVVRQLDCALRKPPLVPAPNQT